MNKHSTPAVPPPGLYADQQDASIARIGLPTMLTGVLFSFI